MPKREISRTIPEGYAELLAAAKDRVRRAHISAARGVNSELVLMYLALGQLILDRQADEGWGTRVLERLAEDLQSEFPAQRGFSRRNLHYCRRAASIFADQEVQQVAALLPWGHVMVLVDKLDHDELRHWYAAQAVEHGWSRNVLEHHIGTQLHTRVDRSPAPAQIPVGPTDSDLVRDLVKDPLPPGLPRARRRPLRTPARERHGPPDDHPAGRARPWVRLRRPPGPAARRRERLLPRPPLLPYLGFSPKCLSRDRRSAWRRCCCVIDRHPALVIDVGRMFKCRFIREKNAGRAAGTPTTQRATAASLLARIEALSARNKKLQEENRTLRRRLEAAHGELRDRRVNS